MRKLEPMVATELRTDVETPLSGQISDVIRDLLESRGVVLP
jgi:hypothetical protein